MTKALLVLFLLVVGCGGQPAATPTASARSTGPPPAGEPVLWVGHKDEPGTYTALDWNGTVTGTLTLGQPIDPNRRLQQAPDGSGFMIQPVKGLAGQFLDRSGLVSATVPPNGAFLAWADDSRHVCMLVPDQASQRWLVGLTTPDTSSPSLHPVALDSSNLQSGIIALGFASCSAIHDRAVITYSFSGRPSEAWVVRLSNGAVLLHRVYPANFLVGIAASADGALIAEDSNQSTGYLLGGTAPDTLIRRTSDGSVAVKLDPSYGVLAFSADDAVALVNTTPWASGVPTHLALVRLSDGAVLWRYGGNEAFAGLAVQPDGSSIAAMLQQATDQSLHPTVDVVLLKADGSSKAVAGQYVRP